MAKRTSPYLFCLLLVCAMPHAARAAIIISEIMYDAHGSDTGHEWVEIKNDGTEHVSLEGWRFLEANVKHKLTSVLGGATLAPGGYAIIADNAENFRADFPDFAGQLFDSAFSISNDGETLAFIDESGSSVATVSYQGAAGAAGDGNSLNLSGGVFVPRTPSPGAEMNGSAIPSPPPKETKTTKTQKEKNGTVASLIDTNIIDETMSEEYAVSPALAPIRANERIVAAAVFSRASVLWWIVALVIALGAGGTLFYARSLKKEEWNIVEQTE